MSAAAMQQTPVVPPRPGRSTEKEASAGLMPQVPPRPVNKRIERSVSPNPHRFAPSPLTQGIPDSPSRDNSVRNHYAHKQHSDDPIERSGSVPMPSVGEEGMEYSAVTHELQEDGRRSSFTGQTHTVGEDIKLYAPKPSLPAESAKKQVMAVTRTDSDRAAQFGIGNATSSHNGDERTASRGSMRVKRPTSSFSMHSDQGTDDEQGIPHIGQRVPMNKHLGDVQAPSPAPGDSPKKHHGRKHSGRGLPPGSYGLHGHGVPQVDKLHKAYYQKHPEALEREQHTPLHDRQNDFAMSSSDLNKLVQNTPKRQSFTGTTEIRGTPTDDVAFQAHEEYTSRMSTSSRPSSMAGPKGDSPPLEPAVLAEDTHAIHVDDSKNPEFYAYGEPKDEDENNEEYTAPILAPDEVQKAPSHQLHVPAIRPHLERRGSSYDAEDPPSRPSSRPKMQRLHSHSQQDFEHTPLEDVEEYEPLFPEEAKAKEEQAKREQAAREEADENEARRHFPSKDIWEDAPSSVHYTAEVSTPDVAEPERRRSSAYHSERPITPAQAFALYQEELAEKEAKGRSNSFLTLSEEKPSWIDNKPHLKAERHHSNRRFPSRDIWEDAPESLCHEAELSGSPPEQNKPAIPARPAKKPSLSPERPAVPDRPKPRQGSGDDAVKQRPPVSDRPKPNIPPRPARTTSGDSKDAKDAKDAAVAKTKPPVPSRPVGGKIAALQAGFMSDLNKRLQLGPGAVKKEEPSKEEEAVEEKEKVPLSDARKSRARGPQRRAPAKSPAPATADAVSSATAPVLAFAMPQTLWSIDPDVGDVVIDADNQVVEPAKENPIIQEPEEPGVSESKGLTLTESPELEPQPKTAPVTETEEKVDVHLIDDLKTTAKTSEPEASSEPDFIPASKPAVVSQQPEPPNTEMLDADDERLDKLTGSSAEHGEEGRGTDKKELTIATNAAGESIMEATVADDADGVEPIDVHEEVKS